MGKSFGVRILALTIASASTFAASTESDLGQYTQDDYLPALLLLLVALLFLLVFIGLFWLVRSKNGEPPGPSSASSTVAHAASVEPSHDQGKRDEDNDGLAWALDAKAAYLFRRRLDVLLSGRALSVVGPPEIDKLLREVGAVATFVVVEAVRRARGEGVALDQSDRYVAQLLVAITADHLSNVAMLEMESLGLFTSYCVNHELFDDLESGTFASAVSDYNDFAMNRTGNGLLQEVGNQVSYFFATNDDKHLNMLAGLFTLLRQSRGPATQPRKN